MKSSMSNGRMLLATALALSTLTSVGQAADAPRQAEQTLQEVVISASPISPDADRIEVVRGAATLRYGTASDSRSDQEHRSGVSP